MEMTNMGRKKNRKKSDIELKFIVKQDGNYFRLYFVCKKCHQDVYSTLYGSEKLSKEIYQRTINLHKKNCF